jgi:hypothetical protein
MQSGDPAAMMAIAADPAMARVQQLMMQNPGLMARMGGQMGLGGNPMAAMMGGMGGIGNAGGGFGGLAPPAQPAAPAPPAPTPAPAPAPIPGAPTTQEEEERLLQEAIRLSMQETEKKDDSKTGEGGGSGCS